MKFLFKIFFLMLVLEIIGCKKNPFDYRTQYLGDWSFTIYSSYPEFDTTYNFNGTVRYGYDDKHIQINWNSSNGYYDNNFDFFEDGSFRYYDYTGDFLSSKKVVFDIGSWYEYNHIIGNKMN